MGTEHNNSILQSIELMAELMHTESPGNVLYPDMAPMRAPHLEFVYRLVAKMHPDAKYLMSNIQGTGLSRAVAHIQSGTVRGPRVNGIVVENSGADWAQQVHSKKVHRIVQQAIRPLSAHKNIQIFYNLDARYAIRTADGHHIYVKALGVFRPGPGVDFVYDPEKKQGKTEFLQDDVEYFTHITFEAGGDTPYNWMNGIVAIGALQSVGGAAVIDCWRLTNFPGVDAEDVYVGR